MAIPAVQTRLGKYATKTINKDFNTDINIGRVGLQLNGDVELKEILIRDYKKDTLISIGELNTSIISFKNLYNSKLNFGDIDIEDLLFNLKTYEGEEDTNLDVFVAKFDDDNPRQGPSEFLFSSSDVSIENGAFRLSDENLDNSEVFEFSGLDANTTDFVISGPNVSSRINKLSFTDSRGIMVKNLMANFEYTLSHMIFNKLNIKTKASELKGDLRFDYKREDLKDFTDKVNVTASFRDSSLSLTELNVFFDEFGINQKANINADLKGTLNNLEATNLDVSTTRNTKIVGDITFVNLFSNEPNSFALNGKFQNLASNYKDLTALLPRILGKVIPSVFSNVGNFRISGTSKITESSVDAKIKIDTDLGLIDSDLELNRINSIDNASYIGNIVFEEFDIGTFLNDPTLKKISANLDLDGKGFRLENLRTDVKGQVYRLNYNNYDYQNIEVSGNLGNKVFNGILRANDPNLLLDFNGLADFSKEIKNFDFNANVGYANLRTLNFVTRDSLSEFKGKVRMTARGSSYDNATGAINIKNTVYKNQDSEYRFEDFDIVSAFANEERTLTINSPDIVSGRIIGKYRIRDIIKLVENSLGSIYTNYIPYEVEKGQYLNFNFNIYSKIAAVFYKDLFLGKNTFIKGKIESDDQGFDLSFNSPEIKFQKYFANDIKLTVDNRNPIYNTFIEIDSLSTGIYNASDFTLINVTKRDTLLIKTEFSGGTSNQDNFDLNLFYTIDETNNSVVGFGKSDIRFKNFEWEVNSEKDTLNKVRFDKEFKNFDIFPLKINQGREEIVVSGSLYDGGNKNLEVDFNNVELVKITPRIDSLALQGVVNGKIDIEQNNGVYLPKSDIEVSNLFVNDYDLGNLKAKIEGNNSITNYDVDIELVNDNLKSFGAKGFLDVAKDNPSIDLDVVFEEFLLDPLNPLGEGVISNIRGLVSGSATVTGSLNKPDINGELFMDRAGLSIPYLNVDYGFDFDSKVTLREQRFIFNNVAMTDSKFFSQGYLNGYIEHDNFSDWVLGLDLITDRLLVLNTDEKEDSLYYGDGFVAGEATIVGPTDQLIIKVVGSTAPGTVFNIPLNDSESFGDNSFIHFLTPEEKQARINGEIVEQIEVTGLELDFDLDVNQNATIEIVIDKEAGSTIKGTGEGGLKFLINTNGTFNMWGDFSVFEGIYNFKYGGFVEKKFEVEQGGSIVWEGDPMGAEINLKAIYKTTANPSVLLDNPITQRIPVEVDIYLTGDLEQPQPDFDLRFPNVTSTVKSELDYRLSSKDERNNQALTLLGTGSFSSGIRGINFTGTISERLSGIVNNIIGGDNDNLNVGIDLELGENTPELQTDNRFGLTLQTQISDKILVNGKLGVPFGTAQQTTITGDVQVDWLLNDDGTFRAKVFNRENTIRNFGEEIGYTQGIGLSYNVEFDTFKELLQIIFSGKNRKDKIQNNVEEKIEEQSDSFLPEYITMKDKKSKSKS
ncbi:translocation/assembly module TamB domain-containing protein [Winogradskyella alexanderae]|uniref:Translocation/assembly module TamB domain-containing protein n=1 Tax=Winogradskyella alexanderae TaxID=2877123 RepID=A0ABS7XT32_9FLAO|nr:translocation/assembly module TamB domain-containing protein [Winogradskyella alexanderae]MCA0132629.1 translocation/assembly module TamB domain-containing protein [Winogradskyella alexanderae]